MAEQLKKKPEKLAPQETLKVVETKNQPSAPPSYSTPKLEPENITAELIGAQGKAQDIGGYYNPNEELVSRAMRPSATLNNTLASF